MMMIRKIFQKFITEKPNNVQQLSKIVHKMQQITLSEEQMQEQMNKRLKQLDNLHKKTQELIDNKIKFPLKLCGTNDKYESRFSYLPDRVMSYYRIPTARINQYLLKMFKASLYAIADRNTQYMNQYWQQGLTKKVLQSIDDAKNKNYQIKVQKESNYLGQIPQTCEIVDSIMIRGLSMNRNQNQSPSQYIKYQEAEQVGLLTYTPKYLTTNNENFINPEKNKNVYSGYEKMLLRTLIRIKSPLRLTMPQFKVPNEVYTWQHICIMQNQMVAMKPLESSYKLQTLMEWLGKYRFGPWRLADIDNFMFGNSPFRLHYDQKYYEVDPVLKNTKLDKSTHVDIRKI